MVEHVYRRACLAREIDQVVMAVCEKRVRRHCEDFGATVVDTSPDQPSATDRVAEAAAILGYTGAEDIVINVQGDEPAVPPPAIEATVKRLINADGMRAANLAESIDDPRDLENPHRIKAIVSRNDRLVYLSRQSVPAGVFDIQKQAAYLRQTCVMAFFGDFLQQVHRLERTCLELVEGIDMLRLIENDLPVASGVSPWRTQPVDTPEDVLRVEALLENDIWFKAGYKCQAG